MSAILLCARAAIATMRSALEVIKLSCRHGDKTKLNLRTCRICTPYVFCTTAMMILVVVVVMMIV
jgi:hypothetical protein